MNERIKELAVEARKEFLKLPTGYRPEQVGMYPQLMEKFAELIVRECVNEIHVADVGDLKGKSYYLDRVSEHIEKHFGVEK